MLRSVNADKPFTRRELLTAWSARATTLMGGWVEDRSKGLTPDRAAGTRGRTAVIDIARCLAWGDTRCQSCYLACPRRDTAIRLLDAKPVIAVSECDGCALCVPACLAVNDPVAIRMAAWVDTVVVEESARAGPEPLK